MSTDVANALSTPKCYWLSARLPIRNNLSNRNNPFFLRSRQASWRAQGTRQSPTTPVRGPRASLPYATARGIQKPALRKGEIPQTCPRHPANVSDA
jgi:hypothetical protein